jgi:hypothetical protein
MQLRNARLCLDCEEIHDGAQCPGCASETFAFIKRWVPAPERRSLNRSTDGHNDETLRTYRELLDIDRKKRPAAGWRLVRGGAVALALIGAAGWMLRRNSESQKDLPTGSDRDASRT